MMLRDGESVGRTLRAGAIAFAFLTACAPKKPPPAPGVYLLNEDYDRVKSRVLIRRVVEPTRARLDFAVYDSNVLLHDPKDYKPKPPEKKVTLAELDFGGSLEKGTLCDRLDETPLTDEEKRSPMAWLPVSEYLLVWDDEISMGLYELGGLVSDETWNDESIVPAYQEISRAYLHKTPAGHEMWALVEFKPWVTFLEGVDDEDGDGFPEMYGRLKRDVVPEKIAEEILANYAGKVLSVHDINRNGGWAYMLVDYWYNKYFTETFEPEEKKAWPDEKARAAVGDELGALPKEAPSVLIRGEPFEGHVVYTVLYVECAAE